MIRLPVSGLQIVLRAPGGAEDLLLMEEARAPDRVLALDLLGRLSDVPEPSSLCVHDFEAALLHLHALVFGGRIVAEAQCPCGTRLDIAFRIADFLSHRAPRRPRNLASGGAAGWYALKGQPGAFRLPTIADQIAVADAPDPVAALAGRCLKDVAAPAKAERAMATLAPALSGPVEGMCPDCKRRLQAAFDVPTFGLDELRVQASQIFEDVHLLATRYHWTEEKILALPNWRRQHYVDRVAAERERAV